MKNVIFEEGSQTIRELPGNYMIGWFDDVMKCWRMDSDLSCDVTLVIKLIKVIAHYKHRYNPNGNDLIKLMETMKLAE